MRHCSSDPGVEVSLDPPPFFFSIFWPSCLPVLTVYYILIWKASLWGCIVCEWQQRWPQGCLETDWIHSFIIRQISWSRCELCMSGAESCSEPSPFLPHPNGEGCLFWMLWGEKDSPRFLYTVCSPLGNKGVFLSSDSHTENLIFIRWICATVKWGKDLNWLLC